MTFRATVTAIAIAAATVINVSSAAVVLGARTEGAPIALGSRSLGGTPSGSSDAEINNIISLAEVSQTTPFDREVVRDVVKDFVKDDPQFILDALNAHAQQEQQDQQAKADSDLLARSALVTVDKDYPYLGDKDAKVEIIYYFDINCVFCKKIDGEMERFVQANPDVKLVYREMPILTDASSTAAQIGGTLFALDPDAYHRFHTILLGRQSNSSADDIDSALRDTVGQEKAKNIIATAFQRDAGSIGATVAERIKDTLATANTAGIAGTPFIYVKGSDTFVRGAAPDLIAQLSAAATKARSGS